MLLLDFSHSSAMPWIAARGSRTMCRNSTPSSAVDSLGATYVSTQFVFGSAAGWTGEEEEDEEKEEEKEKEEEGVIE